MNDKLFEIIDSLFVKHMNELAKENTNEPTQNADFVYLGPELDELSEKYRVDGMEMYEIFKSVKSKYMHVR